MTLVKLFPRYSITPVRHTAMFPFHTGCLYIVTRLKKKVAVHFLTLPLKRQKQLSLSIWAPAFKLNEKEGEGGWIKGHFILHIKRVIIKIANEVLHLGSTPAAQGGCQAYKLQDSTRVRVLSSTKALWSRLGRDRGFGWMIINTLCLKSLQTFSLLNQNSVFH